MSSSTMTTGSVTEEQARTDIVNLLAYPVLTLPFLPQELDIWYEQRKEFFGQMLDVINESIGESMVLICNRTMAARDDATPRLDPRHWNDPMKAAFFQSLGLAHSLRHHMIVRTD